MEDIEKLIEEKGGIMLDIGCGKNKTPGYVGMDVAPWPGVDVVWNWNDIPWPFPDESVISVIASHVVEHVNPADGHFMGWMDEVWRICKQGTKFAIATPHGYSLGYLQDPTHCNPCCEATWSYFDPDHALYQIYEPKPWKTDYLIWSPTANIEVVLRKVVPDG